MELKFDKTNILHHGFAWSLFFLFFLIVGSIFGTKVGLLTFGAASLGLIVGLFCWGCVNNKM